MPFKIVRNDITKMKVDAVVNTANEAPIYSSGVDTAIYKAAGEEKLLEARQKIGFMNEGEVAITDGFDLPAKYIIHAVSPYYYDGESGEEEKLRSCYKKSLKLAYEHKCESIAFPLIATGGFGYPKEEGMRIAVDEINAFLLSREMLIYLVVFDVTSTKLGKNLYPDLEAYIDNNYVEQKSLEEYDSVLKCVEEPMEEFCVCKAMALSDEIILDCDEMDADEYDEYIEEKDSALKDRLIHMSDTFQEYMFYLIAQKGLSHVDVYKRAILDKRQFSKIKKNPDYHPDKLTALRLCIGLTLNLDETKDLLARAGYALSPCDMRDIIFSYFIERKIYDATEIAITLEEHGLPCFIA